MWCRFWSLYIYQKNCDGYVDQTVEHNEVGKIINKIKQKMKKSSTLKMVLLFLRKWMFRRQTSAFMVPIQPQRFIASVIRKSTKELLISVEVIVT
jgi:hypothetical protein